MCYPGATGLAAEGRLGVLLGAILPAELAG